MLVIQTETAHVTSTALDENAKPGGHPITVTASHEEMAVYAATLTRVLCILFASRMEIAHVTSAALECQARAFHNYPPPPRPHRSRLFMPLTNPSPLPCVTHIPCAVLCRMEIAHVTSAALDENAKPGRHVVKIIPIDVDGSKKPEVALGTLELGRTGG